MVSNILVQGARWPQPTKGDIRFMPSPQFSIVIPTRQRHETLGSAIRSVLMQPFEKPKA